MGILNIFESCNVLADFSTITHADWQELRQQQVGFGGSDAGAILGVNKWKSPARLYLEKIGEVESEGAGEAAEWGHIMEPVIAEQFAKRHPEVKLHDFKYLLGSQEHPFMLANVDRLIEKDGQMGLLEIKTASSYVAKDWADNSIPPSYYAQFQHYLSVVGLSWGYFAVLIGGNQYQERYVERDDFFIQRLIEQEALFAQRIELRLPPELDGSESSEKLIKVLFPHIKVVDAEDEKEIEAALTVEGDETFGELLLRKTNVAEEIKTLETELKEIDNKIKAFIGENKYGVWNGWKATYREQAGKSSVDTKLLEERFPEAYQECLKQGSNFRVLTVSKPKVKKEKVKN